MTFGTEGTFGAKPLQGEGDLGGEVSNMLVITEVLL